MGNLNLKLWDSVKKTDPKYLKEGQKGLSSIDGYYVFMKATEAFGTCGIGWGYEILDEDYRTGAPVLDKGKTEIIGHEIDHMLRVKLWFKQGDEKGEVSHYGITRYVYSSKYGLITDEEAPKKSLTDALKKCLSMLGFCADVFMGEFEDDAYRESAVRRAEAERSEKKDAEIQKAIAELDDWLKEQIDSASKVKSDSSFKAAMNAIRRKLITKGDVLEISVTKRLEYIDRLIESRVSNEGAMQHAS